MESMGVKGDHAMVATPSGSPHFSKIRAESRGGTGFDPAKLQDILPVESHPSPASGVTG